MKFQKGFYLGAATAAHQVEGNNTNSDYWVMENLPGSAFTDPSGIACDHYRRYKEEFSRYLPVIKDDDFIGVQNYTRSIVGPDGEQPVSDGAEVTQRGYEYYPKSVAGVIRRVAKDYHGEIFVTENGLATDDDSRRVEFIKRAVKRIERRIWQ